MIHIVFKTQNGDTFPLELEPGASRGDSLMSAAKAHAVPGIDADCGGSMVCGTCHVYIEQQWHAKLPPKSEMEEQILSCVPVTDDRARLSCQIPLTAALDGLVAIVPPAQR